MFSIAITVNSDATNSCFSCLVNVRDQALNKMNVMFNSFGIRFSLKGITAFFTMLKSFFMSC